MRTARRHDESGRPRGFDAVFIHDAVMYLTTTHDLLRTSEKAAVHCRAGGVLLVALDYMIETFRPTTGNGGHEGEGRSLRYLSWTFDPDPDDSPYDELLVFVLRESGRPIRVESETHHFGLFSRQTWLSLLERAGFTPQIVSDPWNRELFVGIRAKRPSPDDE